MTNYTWTYDSIFWQICSWYRTEKVMAFDKSILGTWEKLGVAYAMIILGTWYMTKLGKVYDKVMLGIE